MKLQKLLQKHQKAIVRRWFDEVAATYPPDTAHFLKSQKDPFANPVGNITFNGLNDIFSSLLDTFDPRIIQTAIDPIVRIRAVQQFTAAQAVGFVFMLKPLVRKSLTAAETDTLSAELVAFENRIDQAALVAFEVFVRCREKLYSLKTSVERNRLYEAFHRAGLVAEVPTEDGPASPS